MSFIIKSTKIEVNKINKESNQNYGNYYSVDRFYTLINQYIDHNLKRKSKTLCFITKYLFKSSNYKHDQDIANGRSIWITLLDVFCILCIIGFFSMVFAVVGVSTANIEPDINWFIGFGNGFIKGIKSNIPLLVFAVFFLVVSIVWLVMYFKIRKKNAKLSLKDFVAKKISFVLKYRWLIKTTDKTKDMILKDNDKYDIYLLNKFEQQGGANDRWLNLQIINLLVSIFDDFNLIFKFDNLSEDEYNEINEIIKCDFKNIEILEIK